MHQRSQGTKVMNMSRIGGWCIVATLLALSVALGLNNANAFQPPPPAGEDGVEVLTRGPVHEAFAETISFDPEPGVVVPKVAPEPIEELPPEQRPDGANVDWIPGYWAWDDERTDFLWVSGIWRALPPGRQWVSGYWARAGRGSQWISGYWADAQASDVEYLPEPPATVEAGPNIESPSANHIWSPGCWVWRQNRYAWRPGYWVEAQPNWILIPSHYVWSPRGYVFVDTYYDYSVARRGVLFAPVYFSSSSYSQSGFSYSPRMVINPAVFVSHLFLRPSYGHYYFGDYYASSYSSRGFSPWFSFHASHSGYDPFYAHERWHHRNDRDWDRRVEADYGDRRDREEARPPHTWTAQRERSTRNVTGSDKSFVMTASLDEVAKNKEAVVRFQPVAKEEREQIGQRGQEFRNARVERQKLEAEASDPTAELPAQDRSVRPPGRTSKPVKVKLPKQPIASQPGDRLGQDAPPISIEAPEPDSKIEPKPRKGRGEPRPERGTAEPKPDRPGVERTPRPERPNAEPKPEPPKVEPRPEPPKTEPKPERPAVEPKPEPPKAEPKPEAPKVEPRPEPPKAEPKPDRPKPPKEPKGKGKNKP
jgi:hypothetical protein